MSQSSKPVPLAVPNELLKQIDNAATLTGRSRSELMRLAIEIGLADLKAINYDIAGTIVKAVHSRQEIPAYMCEEETPYPAPAPSKRKAG
jgi:metal-responsive CopG/Arc/MetJ family transcriptional regulator